jgi:hypothetical protein
MAIKETKTEKPKDIDYDSLIEQLVQKVDKEKSLFSFHDFVGGFGGFIFDVAAILLVIYVVAFNSSFSFTDRIVIGFAGAALILSLGQIILVNANETVVKIKYRNAMRNLKPSKEEKLLLKALIKMQSENTEFTLTEIYTMYPEIFTKEKLLERLYES